ncbi:uncharacterized protein LOC126320462 isoform X1 [Schistocerca gregaria]|uniref:uncharacterized protein LOC126320462 isoform X1 n=1 Tax=Schistocerca gregaria TaxID=7010 RepID=UPI00211EDC1A|nr:uncharacterized protein LOC126320462 isoform X1 [Schistocerca gregaria]
MGKSATPAFPPARIKRIMLSDEDVGKIKKETPVLVSLCVEIFIENLVNIGAAIAAVKGAKILSASHLYDHLACTIVSVTQKKAMLQNPTFDFLREIISKVPDAPESNAIEDTADPQSSKKRKRPKPKKTDAGPAQAKKVTKNSRSKSSEKNSSSVDEDDSATDDQPSSHGLPETNVQSMTEGAGDESVSQEKGAQDSPAAPFLAQFKTNEISFDSFTKKPEEEFDYDE